MYSKFQLAKKYLHYYLTASNGKGHGTHSPFVFDFIANVLNDKRDFYAYGQIEDLRKQLLHDQAIVDITDFGAGSASSTSNKRRICDIAKHAAKNKKFAQLLFRIANYYQPKTVLELGTSLGISSAYFAAANPHSKVITIEGSPEIAAIADQNFAKLDFKNIDTVTGKFDDVLPDILKTIGELDLSFVDGNHRKGPTIKYFNELTQYSQENSILIFDDIHWSREMEEAWNIIKTSERISLTIDLFFIGLAFLRKDFKVKQDFIIRF